MRIPPPHLRHLLPLVMLYVAVSGGWFIAIPPFEGPDEFQHYDYARYVAFTGHLPDHIPSVLNEGGWFTVQWVQEGTYYWTLGHLLRLAGAEATPPGTFVGNPVSRWQGGLEASVLRHNTPVAPALLRGIRLGRLVNALCGLGTLLCVFAAVRTWMDLAGVQAGQRPSVGAVRVAALAAASLVLIPEFGVHHVLVSNDPPAAFQASLATWLLLRWYVAASPSSSWRWSAAAGAISGLAITTKLTAGSLLLMAPLLFWAKRRTMAWREVAGWGVALLATGSWAFARNWVLFGDPLATALKQTLVAQHGNPVHFQPGELQSYRNLLHVLFHGFWVSVGWSDWGPDATWIWLLYGVITMLLIAAVGVAIVIVLRPTPRMSTMPKPARALLGVLLTVIALHTVAFLIALAHTPGYSMRYFLPLTVPLAVVATAAFDAVRRRVSERVVRWICLAFILTLALAWLATFAEALLAFRFGGRFELF